MLSLPGVGGGLTARHSADSVRRRQVTGAERTSGASSSSGASTCASHRMRQRILAQCARGGPATLLMGTIACSAETVLELYPTRNLPHYSAVGWHACNHEKRGPCIVLHQHTRSTSDAQQTSCRRRAGRHWGYSRVLTGTQGYSAAGWHPCNHQKRGRCTVWHQHTRSTSDVQQPSCRRCTEGF